MKKLFFVLALAIVSAASFAQAPSNIQSTFSAKYPDVTGATWTTDDGNYVAAYTDKDGMHNWVVFDKNARIVRNEVELDMKEYPATVKEYYVKKYPDEKNYRLYSLTDENGDKTYYIPSENRGVRYYFDKTGNFLREEKNKMKEEIKEHTDHDK